MSFTPIRDVNLEILSKMDDRALLNVCATNKYAWENLCQDETFWHKRIISKYGNNGIITKPKDRTWKNHYMHIVIDLDLYKDEPAMILSRIEWSPKGFEFSYYINLHEQRISLSKAPEFILNAFYLLKLGPFFNNKTAYELMLEKSKENPNDQYIDGKKLFINYRIEKGLKYVDTRKVQSRILKGK